MRVFKSLILFFLVLTLSLTALSCTKREAEREVKSGVKQSESEEPPPPPTCTICGVEGEVEAVSRRPVAVMVENLSSIRPQSGLSEACMVFEALAEGGITRFCAIYVHRDADNVGPVRSARNYYAALAKGFDALYVHCGGSKYAMEAIKQWGVADLDQFFYPKAYWRVKGIEAPHNLFTSISKIREVAEGKGFDGNIDYEGFPHKPDASLESRPQHQRIVIEYSSAPYKVEYKYDSGSNSYLRFNGGKAHLDKVTGRQLQPKNVVVMYCPTGMLDAKCLDIQVVGSGSCLVFRDGKAVKGTWEKKDVDSPLIFVDKQGKEVPLNVGQTWVEVVKTDTPVTVEETATATSQ